MNITSTNSNLSKENKYITYDEMIRKSGLFKLKHSPHMIVYSKGKPEIKPLFISNHTYHTDLYMMPLGDESWQDSEYYEWSGTVNLTLSHEVK